MCASPLKLVAPVLNPTLESIKLILFEMENPPHPFEAQCLSLAKIAAMIGTKQVNLIMRKEPMVLNARRYAFLNFEATLNGQSGP